jgi:hypothetical protein
MQIGIRNAIVLLALSFLIFWESYGSDFGGLAAKFFVPLLFFTLVSSFLAKLFAKADFMQAALASASAFSVFLFIQAAALALIGLLPLEALFSNWTVPFLAVILLLFVSWTAFAFAYLEGFSTLAPGTALRNPILIFIISALATSAVFYLLGVKPITDQNLFALINHG